MLDAACDWAWATCLELSVIYSLRSPSPGLGVYRKRQAAHQGPLLPALGLGDGQLKSPRFGFENTYI